MNNIIFTYSEEAALSAGQSSYLSEGGAYILTITEAKFTESQGGAKAIEFSGETEEGLKVNYLSVYYIKKDGQTNKYGNDMINAMMGICDIPALTSRMKDVSTYIAPEFTDKKVGLLLQKVLRNKNNGDTTYGFEIVMPFIPSSRKTLQENKYNQPAETVSKRAESMTDKDERKSVPHSDRTAPGNSAYPPVDTYDDIPY